MRVGTICYATEQGIGRMAKTLREQGLVTEAAVIAHGRYETHWDWHPDCLRIMDMGRVTQLPVLEEWARKLDVLLCVETPFVWELIPTLRGVVRTVLIPMHECTPQRYYDDRNYWPDLFLCVSRLDYDRFGHTCRARYMPWPVNVEWRQRNTAEVFVHNAGHGGMRGRNGTHELLHAWNFVRSPAKMIVRSQSPLPWHPSNSTEVFCPGDERDGQTLQIRIRNFPHSELFAEGDCFVFPEKFCGDSLPLAEARASGMLVMGSNRYPMNTWLPQEPLIQVRSYQKARVGGSYLEFDEAVIDPKDIARRIDAWYGRDITEYSLTGRAWAESMSWSVWRDEYRRAITGC